MHNFDPNDIDDLFKAGAERHEFSFNEAAWNDMSARLDRRDRRRAIVWLTSALVLLIGAIGYYISNPQNQQSIVSDIESQEHTVIDNQNKIGSHDSSSQVYTSPSLSIQDLNNDDSKNRINKDNHQGKKLENRTEKNTVAALDNSSRHEIVDKHNTSSDLPTSRLEVQKTNEESKPALILNTTKIVVAAIPMIEPVTFAAAKRTLPNVKLVSGPSTSQELQTDNGKYFFAAYAAPEWSSVGLLSQGRRGWRTGVSAGAGVSKHLEVSLGFGISKKVYDGSGVDYTMNDGWVDDIKPATMKAKCYITEIPLAATYYRNGRTNDGFFVGLGISSYLISSEWYGFEYSAEDENRFLALGSAPVREVINENENQHYVGVGTLSIGYQKHISANTFIQLAPYTQIPLTGIGSGKVSMYSSGITVALKFGK